MNILAYTLLLLPLFFSTSWATPAPQPGEPLCYRYEKVGKMNTDLMRVHPNCLTDAGKARIVENTPPGEIDFSSSDSLNLDDYVEIDPKNRMEDISFWSALDDNRYRIWKSQGKDPIEKRFVTASLEVIGFDFRPFTVRDHNLPIGGRTFVAPAGDMIISGDTEATLPRDLFVPGIPIADAKKLFTSDPLPRKPGIHRFPERLTVEPTRFEIRIDRVRSFRFRDSLPGGDRYIDHLNGDPSKAIR